MQPIEDHWNACRATHLQHLVGVEQPIVVLHYEPPANGVGQGADDGAEPLQPLGLALTIEASDMDDDLARAVGAERVQELPGAPRLPGRW